jgi:hypothetical protein
MFSACVVLQPIQFRFCDTSRLLDTHMTSQFLHNGRCWPVGSWHGAAVCFPFIRSAGPCALSPLWLQSAPVCRLRYSDWTWDRGFDFQEGSREILLSSAASKPAQGPIQWVARNFSPGVEQPGRGADHPHLSSVEVKNVCSYLLAYFPYCAKITRSSGKNSSSSSSSLLLAFASMVILGVEPHRDP